MTFMPKEKKLKKKLWLQAQANKMVKFSNEKFPLANHGVTVTLRVPDVDRGCTDPS